MEDLASLDRVCLQLGSEMGGVDGCTRWTQCCSTAGECCRRQRRRTPATTISPAGAPASCEATWDGFSCWDRAAAGAVVRQQCPVYMDRSDVTGLSLLAASSPALLGRIARIALMRPICYRPRTFRGLCVLRTPMSPAKRPSRSKCCLLLRLSLAQRTIGAHWRHLVNTVERSVHGTDVVLRQILVITSYLT